MFSDLLTAAVDAKSTSLRAFAISVGRTPSYMSKVARGVAAPPDDFESWVEILGLTGEDRTAFIEEGWIAKCPKPAQEMIRRWRK